ncbi:hypothetical protein Sa4125_25040 [Aureimonas sp. SA4125]|uniref:phage GP46 family protein n=1 Tax=Aureimonas sp. SA4125 TaxID=2826993 RepID=UPI001CC50C76|nr:phage GP46 family protein [Aureimonas sp. SA4125]BDA84962.1 hypothetical protein Sa4125_25040 [Aureimonas sp. SA4125]
MRIVPLGETGEPLLSPDLIWDTLSQTGDIAISPLSDPVNPGGLVSRAAIATAVIICLQTDIRVEATELRDGDTNKGWPGDGFDLQPGEVPLGSRLWQLRRSALSEGIELMAEDFAREALQTLIDQGVAVRIDITATADRPANRLDLAIALYGRAGTAIYQGRFAVLWDQSGAR